MLKRIWALVLCAVLLVTALPVRSFAAPNDEVERICGQIRDTYQKTYAAVGDLSGYCGEMAAWELYYLGITKSVVSKNGNQMYDELSITDQINEGFQMKLYPASAYTIEEALNTITGCGTKDAYNIVAGYHWTTTTAGSLYGHVTVIHAILDGMVYFTEGFGTPFNMDPSQPMICSIAEFAQYYDEWTGFEGIIHFGRGNYIDGYEMFGCNQFVRAGSNISLMSLPDFAKAETVRTVAAGERLRAVALCKDENDVMFYQILDGGETCYLPVDMVEPVKFVYNDLTVTDAVLPVQVAKGRDFKLSGVIRSEYNKIYSLVVQITDAQEQVILSYDMVKDGNMVDLGHQFVNDRVDISGLAEGSYTYNVYCDMVNHYDLDGVVIGDMQRVLAVSSEFTVGDAAAAPQARVVQAEPQEEKAGWQYENGNWYFYEVNTPRVGWFCDNGLDYYLLSDGSAATGWQEINGKNRYFTETGVMRTGWLECAEGHFYMLSNGAAATGWKQVDGVLYCFGEDGQLVTDTVAVYKDQTYNLDSTGAATIA